MHNKKNYKSTSPPLSSRLRTAAAHVTQQAMKGEQRSPSSPLSSPVRTAAANVTTSSNHTIYEYPQHLSSVVGLLSSEYTNRRPVVVLKLRFLYLCDVRE
ncbi:hypothetical protein M8C21_000299 [Ambrosia artemisiifolia]|uniref:Uncharacterized protein n=1 Tax=Ambrosia artemisiifolia TaxID=4212 RepID=A0AAD5BVV0_AMBAR|nr:hypothetical protein M8C21_000299 [Ambrosia artemisiifolia]